MNITVEVIKVEKLFIKNYCYLIYDHVSHEAVIIDPAWQRKKIEEKIAEKNLTLRAILVTHSHMDHIDLVKTLAVSYDCEVWASELIKPDRLHKNAEKVNSIKVAEDKSFVVGNISIDAFSTPGHSKDSVCYKIGENLFSGDTLFIEGCGACLGQGASAEELFESVQKLKAVLSPDTRIFPGHKFGAEPGMDYNYVLDNNIYIQMTEKKHFINFRMRKEQRGLFSFK